MSQHHDYEDGAPALNWWRLGSLLTVVVFWTSVICALIRARGF